MDLRKIKLQVRTCTTCGSTLDKGSTVFYCPNCGEAIIARCKRCRALSRSYVCPKCGFEGP
ncbi:MAG TPA: DUF1610 domain-containing protein [Euryarchaeota archaeon]|nr:DUF1610 domain-containing protein [Euryarchaeota archaeon]